MPKASADNFHYFNFEDEGDYQAQDEFLDYYDELGSQDSLNIKNFEHVSFFNKKDTDSDVLNSASSFNSVK